MPVLWTPHGAQYLVTILICSFLSQVGALGLTCGAAIAQPTGGSAGKSTAQASSKQLTPPVNQPVGSTAAPVSPSELGDSAEPLKLAPVADPFPVGAVEGKVVASDGGRVIGGAQVVLSRVGEEHKRYETTADKDGKFYFEYIDAGRYELTASGKDMLAHSIDVLVTGGTTDQVKVALDDLEPVDVMRITGKRSLIHPENITSRTNLDHRFIQEYKSGNDLRDLIQSTPGVMNDSYGNVITRGEHNAVNYVVDDVIIPEAAGVLQQSQPISPRSLQSAQIDVGGYEAQDGGGPLGAVARLKTLPIVAKPNFTIGQQIGGPIAGNIYFNSSGAFSQKPGTVLNKLRFEASGQFRGTSLRIAPPTKNFVGNGGADINVYGRLEYQLTNRDLLKLDVSINESYMRVPTSRLSGQFGVRQFQQDRQDYFILSWKHKFAKFFDELNLHFLNGFYAESFRSTNNFDPSPDFNADQPLVSIAAKARRTNYIFSAQGDITKTIAKTHNIKLGFLTELRPVKTSFSAQYFNADLIGSITASNAAFAQGAALAANGDIAGAAQINSNPFPYGGNLSPFTLTTDGPRMTPGMGNYTGFRWLQSAYIQDRWKPQHGFWKRLTLDNGVRFDLQRSVFGNALGLASALAQTPGVQPFSLKPFETQRICAAQASGRFGASFVINKNTVLRGSFSQIFTPTPVDYFLTPIAITGTLVNGVYQGTPRPLQPTRGRLVDVSLEQQIGPRFATRTNLFYKYLRNFGDSGVIGNLPIYNRLTNAGQEAYGVETRMDYKGGKDGYGLNGFLSNTISVAYLRGAHGVSGGFYDFPQPPLPKYPDHDRRYQGVAGLGYRSRQNWWVLGDVQVLSGLQNSVDRAIFGPHGGRTSALTLVSFSGGYQIPASVHKKHPLLPSNFDVRIENALNQRLATNLGSPFQGTRYTLPVRVLAGCSWTVGKDTSKLVSNPTGKSIKNL